ncbi:hypothetical protein F66182_17706, partial [Fusarium sp. NRRL 66182]
MGLTDFFSDLVSGFGLTEAHAEAPPAEQNDDSVAEEQEEKTEESAEPAEESTEESTEESEEAEPEAEAEEAEEGEEEEEEGEEEEEEEEEEPEDIKPKLEEDCANSKTCAPFKHHFDECVERVTRAQEDGDSSGPQEDCVEE